MRRTPFARWRGDRPRQAVGTLVLVLALVGAPAVASTSNAGAATVDPEAFRPMNISLVTETLAQHSPCLTFWQIQGTADCNVTLGAGTAPFADGAATLHVERQAGGEADVRLRIGEYELRGTISTYAETFRVIGGYNDEASRIHTEDTEAPGIEGGPLKVAARGTCDPFPTACRTTMALDGFVLWDPYPPTPVPVVVQPMDFHMFLDASAYIAPSTTCDSDFGEYATGRCNGTYATPTTTAPFDRGDGTVRWTRAADGSMTLTFFVQGAQLSGTLPWKGSAAFTVTDAIAPWGTNVHTLAGGAPGSENGPLFIGVKATTSGYTFDVRGTLYVTPPLAVGQASQPTRTTTAAAVAAVPVSVGPRFTG